ncbi:hypothetical protein BKA69DRAFT_1107586 [Paraphysoderma sedebokerense]|nr:hypothetical protein BKA69DRAFT_1107586 [Paraphysoderma sedebokerense]
MPQTPNSQLLADIASKVLNPNTNVTFICGTGTSMGASDGSNSVLSWAGLIESGERRANISPAANAVPTVRASEIRRVLGEDDFNQWIRETFGNLHPDPNRSQVYQELRLLEKAGCYLATTNYDTFIQHPPDRTGLCTLTYASTHQNLKKYFDKSLPGVLHLHGAFNWPNKIVFGEDDYSSLLAATPEASAYRLIINAIFALHTVIFIGCGDGLNDPHFTNISQRLQPLREFCDVYAIVKDPRSLPNWITPIIIQDYPDIPNILRSFVPMQTITIHLSSTPSDLQHWSRLLLQHLGAVGQFVSLRSLTTGRNLVQVELPRTYAEEFFRGINRADTKEQLSIRVVKMGNVLPEDTDSASSDYFQIENQNSLIIHYLMNSSSDIELIKAVERYAEATDRDGLLLHPTTIWYILQRIDRLLMRRSDNAVSSENFLVLLEASNLFLFKVNQSSNVEENTRTQLLKQFSYIGFSAAYEFIKYRYAETEARHVIHAGASLLLSAINCHRHGLEDTRQREIRYLNQLRSAVNESRISNRQIYIDMLNLSIEIVGTEDSGGRAKLQNQFQSCLYT